MKLKLTVVIELPVTDLADYQATTLEQAATNQELWFLKDETQLLECLTNATLKAIKVEAIA